MNNKLQKLKNDIRESLKKGNADLALDRLHTLTMNQLRTYCSTHKISIVDEKGDNYPLNSLIGMLIKYYKKENLISDFTEQSLKQSISLYNEFNEIRNNKSYAHDNTVLSDEESLYVVNTIINMLNFLNYIETGESQLISSSVIDLNDIYKYICLNYGITTKRIAEHFSVSIDEIRNMLMELYMVDGIICPMTLSDVPEDDECQWSKVR